MFIGATSPLVLCMYNFVLNIFIYYYVFFLSARGAADSIKRNCASGWFVRMENNKCTPNTNNYV